MIRSGHARVSSAEGDVAPGDPASMSPGVEGLKARQRTVVASGKARHRCSNSLYLRVMSEVCSQESRPMTPRTLRWLWRGARGEVVAVGESSGKKRKCILPVFHGKNLKGLFWDSL